jgi:dephospho-CoA kinase
MIVGLTGGIATGKSTVARLFVECGARLVDADVLAREAVVPGRPAYEEIVAAFGQDVRRADGTLDRERLGRLVFGNPAQLAQLNAIVHPHVVLEQERRCREIESHDPHAVIIYDAALLIETGAHTRTDRVIVVTADAKLDEELELKLLNILKASEFEVGVVVNFGEKLEFTKKGS